MGAAVTLFNHSIHVGFWTLANDRNGGLIGLGPCCDPAIVSTCPGVCTGTTAETPRMMLAAWPAAELRDKNGQPVILGVFDVNDMGLSFSFGSVKANGGCGMSCSF